MNLKQLKLKINATKIKVAKGYEQGDWLLKDKWEKWINFATSEGQQMYAVSEEKNSTCKEYFPIQDNFLRNSHLSLG